MSQALYMLQLNSTMAPQYSDAVSNQTSNRILILDDQEEIAVVLTEMVRLLGYDAIHETSPQRAIERLEDEAFDLVLSDYRMPEMNGEEFFETAISIRPELQERFVFLTGDLLNEQTQNFLARTGVPYLAKPFNLKKAQAVITSVLEATPALA